MKTSKLKLNLQELEVASFDVDAEQARTGTVQAHEWVEDATPRCTGGTCWTWCAPYC
jgi:hypothetical protein